jgi:hypothetical protein
MLYALIGADGALIRKQDHDARPADPVGKGWRWFPVELVEAAPGPGQVRDTDAEALEGDSWVVRQQVRPMTAQEQEAERLASLRESDGHDMARMVEDIMVAIATGGAAALTRGSFPDAVWRKINARRALRGLGAV